MATIAHLSVLLEAKGQREFLGSLGKVTAAITGAVVATGKLAERGGQVLTVQSAFTNKTLGQVGALEELRAATLGLVSDYDLMQQANTALTLGSAENTKQFAELAATAQQLGRALGLDTAFALNSLNIGIARQSRLVLDNLGLIVSAETANRKYAAALGVTVEQLTDAQRAEAFRIEALEQARQKTEELGEVTLNAGDAFREFVVELGNTKDALATNAAESSYLRAVFGLLTEGTRSLRGETEGLETAFVNFGLAVAGFDPFATEGAAKVLTYEDAVAQLKAQIEDSAAVTNAGLDDYIAFREELARMGSTIREVVVPEINPLTGKLNEIRDVTQGVTVDVDEYGLRLFVASTAMKLYREELEDTTEETRSLSAETRSLAGDLGAISSLLGFLPGLGPVARGFSTASGIINAGTRLFGSSGTGSGAETSASVTSASFEFRFPPAKSPTDAARDPEIARMFIATLRELESDGFRLS